MKKKKICFTICKITPADMNDFLREGYSKLCAVDELDFLVL